MNKLSQQRLVDTLVDAYVGWREACLQVSDAYGAWASQTRKARDLRGLWVKLIF